MCFMFVILPHLLGFNQVLTLPSDNSYYCRPSVLVSFRRIFKLFIFCISFFKEHKNHLDLWSKLSKVKKKNKVFPNFPFLWWPGHLQNPENSFEWLLYYSFCCLVLFIFYIIYRVSLMTLKTSEVFIPCA